METCINLNKFKKWFISELSDIAEIQKEDHNIQKIEKVSLKQETYEDIWSCSSKITYKCT